MGYNFYLPVSLMEENMNRAQAENAVMTQKFWVRKESFSPSLTTVPLTPGNSKASKITVEGVKQFGTIKRATAAGEGTESPVCLVPRMEEITAIELSLNDFFNGRQGNHTNVFLPPLLHLDLISSSPLRLLLNPPSSDSFSSCRHHFSIPPNDFPPTGHLSELSPTYILITIYSA
jgi:hypothetical protein